MTKPRVTTADRLSNIIEVVELGRRSGLLTVERGAPPSLEQGELYFAQGRAVYATVEGLTGREALSVLAGWGQCKFAFEPNAPAPAPNVTAPHPAQSSQPGQPSPGRPAMSDRTGANGAHGMQGSGGYGAPQRAQATPPRGAPSSFNWNTPGSRPLPDPLASSTGPVGPLSPGAQPGTQPGTPWGPQSPSPVGGFAASNPSGPALGAGSWPAGWPSTASGSAPANGSRGTGQLNWSNQTGQLPSVTPSWSSTPSTPSQATGPFGAGGSGGASVDQEALQRRPHRAPDVRDLMSVVSAYNLSRSHRTILLLADGEHTVLDLARLSSKPVEEVAALLTSLERLGLVYYF